MIPGARTAEGQIRIVAGPPAPTDPRLGGFALNAVGEIYCVGTQSAFSPADLFLNSEQGAWYDPSDLSTMFQDSVGTTPVTADGQPVGLILDKSQGMVLGPELVTNGDFSSGLTGWAYPAGTTLVSGQARIVGLSGAGVGDGGNCLGQNVGVVGKCYRVSFDATWVSGAFNLTAGQLYVTQKVITPAQNGGVKTRYTYTAYYDQALPRIAIQGIGGEWDIDNVSVREIYGNHASQATSAARPLYKTDGTYHWLQFDGIDDSLSTAAIDFTSTDKMSVFAGAVKSQDASFRVLCEGVGNPNSIPGSFSMGLPLNGNDTYMVCNAAQMSGNAFSGPSGTNKAVLTAAYDLRGVSHATTTKLRLNAVELTGIPQGNATAGTGNFANGPLCIGARVDGREPFNGNIYSLIVRGALSTPEEITETETWVNGKIGAY